MRVHCPHCKSALTVGAAAAGKAGRCPMCRQVFVVPLADELLDDAIGQLLQEEPPAPAVTDDDDIPPPPKPSPSIPMKKTRDYMPRKKEEAAAVDEHDRRGPEKEGEKVIHRRPDGKRVYVVRSAITHGKKVDEEINLPGASPDSGRATPSPPQQRPVFVNPSWIRLEVGGVTASGVHLKFPETAMMRPAFRASMPMWCIGCGEQDPSKLVARPLAWVDRTHASDHNVGEVESHYCVHLRPGQTAREVVESMNRLEHLNMPLSSPMPYFVCDGCAGHISVDAINYVTSHGTECQVNIPSGSYALEWLARVNGIVGEEYEMLQQGVKNLETDAWRDLPDSVRERISGWFSFQGGEHFLAFIGEADFTKKDAGLGGIVITDDRLVYCKYTHKGMIPLHGQGDLLLMQSGVFTEVVHQHSGHQRKLVRVRTEDVSALINAMTQANTSLNIMKVETVKGQMNAPPKLPAEEPPPAPEEKRVEDARPPRPTHPLPRISWSPEP